MSKKLKIVLALAAGVVILSLGGGAIVMAATGSSTTSTATTTTASQCNGTFGNGAFTAAAATLGVTEQQLADAFQQANVQAQRQSIAAALAQASNQRDHHPGRICCHSSVVRPEADFRDER